MKYLKTKTYVFFLNIINDSMKVINAWQHLGKYVRLPKIINIGLTFRGLFLY